MTDHSEVIDTIMGLYLAIDDKDIDTYRRLVSDECVVSAPIGKGGTVAVVEGADEVVSKIGHAMSLFDVEQHFVTNTMVGVEGDVARVKLYVWSPLIFAEQQSETVGKGAYRAEHILRRTDAGWRVARSDYSRTWTEGASELENVRTRVFGAAKVEDRSE
jgi:ketosteroid isomerase-like protein